MKTPRSAVRLASAHTSTANPHSDSEAGLLESWDDDIVRACRACARKRGRQADQIVADVAQDARLAVVLAIRKTGIDDEQYLRRVISNSARNSTRQRLVVARQVSDDFLEEIREEPTVRDVLLERRIRRWLYDLPRQLKDVFHLLYRRGLSQREAAEYLGVSQPRVAKLHRQLLERGSDGLRDLAA